VTAALAGLAALLAVAALAELAPVRRREEGAAVRRAAAAGRGDSAAADRGRAAAGRSARAVRALASLGSRLRGIGRARVPPALAERIAAAGAPASLGPREVMTAKLASAVAALPAALLLGAAAPGRLGPALIAAGPVAGFMAPDWWLARRARSRAREVRRELPGLIDLLRVSIEAGLAPGAALTAVAERADGPLAAEWRAVGREVALGVPLGEALARSVAHVPLPEVRTLVAAIERATRHGAPLGPTLAAQARDARAARRRRIEEEAARAGPKIQLVVALLLVPSVLLLVAAALLAAFLGGGGLPAGP
jgi:tight adherence protein C